MTRFDAARGVDNAAALPTPPQPKRTNHALHKPDNLTRQLHGRGAQWKRRPASCYTPRAATRSCSGGSDVRQPVRPVDLHPALDAVTAAPANHKVLFENDRLRVLEVILHPNEEEPVHHHRWPSVFVFDQLEPPVHDITPEGEVLPPPTATSWSRSRNGTGQGCLVVHVAPQPPGRVLNASDQTVHGVRIEMKV